MNCQVEKFLWSSLKSVIVSSCVQYSHEDPRFSVFSIGKVTGYYHKNQQLSSVTSHIKKHLAVKSGSSLFLLIYFSNQFFRSTITQYIRVISLYILSWILHVLLRHIIFNIQYEVHYIFTLLTEHYGRFSLVSTTPCFSHKVSLEL